MLQSRKEFLYEKGSLSMKNEKKNKAFTLAEILISITVIGVVAVLTYPTLQQYWHETAIKVKKKALYTRTAQAVSLFSDLKKFESAYDFVNNGYRDIYAIDRVCGNNEVNIFGCNLPLEIFKPDGTAVAMPTTWAELNSALVNFYWEDTENHSIYEYTQPNLKSASFYTDNGESVNLFFNPNCKNYEENNQKAFYSGKYACINIIYDVNGGDMPPNTIGKDVGFITVFSSRDPLVVSPFFDDENLGPIGYSSAKGLCKAKGFNYRLPTEFEMASMFINSKLFGLADDGASGFWAVNPESVEDSYYLHARSGYIEESEGANLYNVRCLHR